MSNTLILEVSKAVEILCANCPISISNEDLEMLDNIIQICLDILIANVKCGRSC